MNSVVAVGLAVLFIAVGQTAAAPLFTAANAAPAFGVVFLAVLTVFKGSRTGMIATPVLAIAEAWLRGLEPGVLLVAYAPVVPLADLASRGGRPLFGPGVRLTGAVLLAGAWARSTALLVVVLGGASVGVSAVVFQLLVPGALIDMLLVAAVYVPLRVGIGEPGREPWMSWR